MTAKVLIVKNIGREGPGLLRNVLREHGVDIDLVEIENGEQIPDLDGYSALIVLGGPASANDDSPEITSQLRAIRHAIDNNVPYIGIGLGLQLLARAAGGSVVVAEREVGFVDMNGQPYVNDLTHSGRLDPLFESVHERFPVFQLHGESALLADGIECLATGPGCPTQAIRVGRRAYGLQAHIEIEPAALDVLAAEDEMLAEHSLAELRSEMANVADRYSRVGKTIFTNFLRIAGLVSTVDLNRERRESIRSGGNPTRHGPAVDRSSVAG